MDKYLESSEYIDWKHPNVSTLAYELSNGVDKDQDIALKCFEWVRDKIKHSSDFKLNPVTCKASDVLTHGTGYCYAKSHLLAALLRANKIPAGLCYQRLSVFEDGSPYSLHGLNAIYLKDVGWYRVDPRGNKAGVDAQFSPPREKLAFPIAEPNEADFKEIWHAPLPIIVETLEKYKTYSEVLENLPDIQIVR